MLLEEEEDNDDEDETGSPDADGDTTRSWFDTGDADFCRKSLASASSWPWLTPAPVPVPAPDPDPDPDPDPVSVFERDRILDVEVFLYIGVDDAPAMVDSVWVCGCGFAVCGVEANVCTDDRSIALGETKSTAGDVVRSQGRTSRAGAGAGAGLRSRREWMRRTVTEKGPDQGPERQDNEPAAANRGADRDSQRACVKRTIERARPVEFRRRSPRGQCEK